MIYFVLVRGVPGRLIRRIRLAGRVTIGTSPSTYAARRRETVYPPLSLAGSALSWRQDRRRQDRQSEAVRHSTVFEKNGMAALALEPLMPSAS